MDLSNEFASITSVAALGRSDHVNQIVDTAAHLDDGGQIRRVFESHPPSAHSYHFVFPPSANVFRGLYVEPGMIFRVRPAFTPITTATALVGRLHTRAVN